MKKVCLLLILILSIFIISCDNTAKKEEPAKSPEQPKQEKPEVAKGPVQLPPDFNKFFVGTLEGKKIKMNLSKYKENINGTYSYGGNDEYSGEGKLIAINGKVNSDGTVALEETDDEGKKRATFNGKFENAKVSQFTVLQVSGKWTKEGTNSSAPFALNEEVVDLGNGISLINVEKKDTDKKLQAQIIENLPKLDGKLTPQAENFNKEVEKTVTEKIASFKKELQDILKDETEEMKKSANEVSPEDDVERSGNYIEITHTITKASADLLSIVFLVSQNYKMSAHPGYYTFVINYDLQKGKEVQLSDIFKPGTNYLETISKLSRESLLGKKRDDGSGLDEETVKGGTEPKPDNFKSWNIYTNRLLFNFDPYQVASYAEGPQEAFIPYSKIKELINTETPVAKFVK